MECPGIHGCFSVLIFPIEEVQMKVSIWATVPCTTIELICLFNMKIDVLIILVEFDSCQ
jgi:hypothetical protein